MANPDNWKQNFTKLGPSYNDINVNAFSLPNGSVAPADVTDFLGVTGLKTKAFAVNDFVTFDDLECDHSYDEGSSIFWHIHFTPYEPVADGTYSAKFHVAFYYNYGATGVWQPVTDVYLEHTAIVESGNSVSRAVWTTWDKADSTGNALANLKINSRFAGIIKRVAATTAEHPSKMIINRVGFHYKQDSNGSRAATSK